MMLSFVIPAFNEAQNIGHTIEEIEKAVSDISGVQDIEIIVVDDASTDKTFELIKGKNDKNIRAIRLSRRSGSHVALRAGLDVVHGDAAICISADGQDNPQAIKDLILSWQQSHDVVWALRRSRVDEPLPVKIFAKIFYKLLSWFGEVATQIDLSRADFYLLDRKVIEAIRSCGERNTSLFGLIVWLGFSQGFIEYDRRPRRAGQSKWNFRSRLQLAQNWIIAFSGIPLKLITYVGFFIAFAGFLYAVLVVSRWLALGSPILGWPSVMTAILLLGGVQMMMLGVIGEYLWRTLDESRNRPGYFIEKDSSL